MSKKAVKTIKSAIKKTMKAKRKLVLVNAVSFADAKHHIGEAFTEKGKVTNPMAWVSADIFELLKERENYKNAKTILFPVRLETPLTKDECKKYLKYSIKKSAKEKKIAEENLGTIAIIGFFEDFVGRKHFDTESLKSFAEAILELSEERIIVMPDPKNAFSFGVPMRRMFDALGGGKVTAYSPFLNEFVDTAITVEVDPILARKP
ncbi:MAG: hypothetical protein ACTSSK_03675 [Candidatus Heimdallarchaeota archaeon]